MFLGVRCLYWFKIPGHDSIDGNDNADEAHRDKDFPAAAQAVFVGGHRNIKDAEGRNEPMQLTRLLPHGFGLIHFVNGVLQLGSVIAPCPAGSKKRGHVSSRILPQEQSRRHESSPGIFSGVMIKSWRSPKKLAGPKEMFRSFFSGERDGGMLRPVDLTKAQREASEQTMSSPQKP